MPRSTIRLCGVAVCFLASLASAEDWPTWRGPRGDGSSLEKGVPTKWSAQENIAWQTQLPGLGHASPIVHGDHIFTVTCITEGDEAGARKLLCLDRKTGKLLWAKTVLVSPLEHKHKLNSFASSTPATDGKLVYVSFLDLAGEEASTDPKAAADAGANKAKNAGSIVNTITRKGNEGSMFIAAYDYEGNRKWAVRPGVFSSVHGYCSSPVLYKDFVIINGDHDGPAYLVALDKHTGKQIWKTPRENKTRSYCTPIIRDIGGRTQLLLSGSKCVASFNPDTGERIWILDGPTEQYVASLVYNGELLFLTCGFPEEHVMGIRPDGSGNVTKSHVAWHHKTKDAAYVPSPIAAGDYFICPDDFGTVTCYVAKTGEMAWREKIARHFSASTLLIDGLVHITADEGLERSDKGVTFVIKPGPKLDVVAKNVLPEPVYASSAVSQGQIFIRGEKTLWCVGK